MPCERTSCFTLNQAKANIRFLGLGATFNLTPLLSFDAFIHHSKKVWNVLETFDWFCNSSVVSFLKNYGILGDLVPSLGFALPLHIA
jgi:hypothetical protein